MKFGMKFGVDLLGFSQHPMQFIEDGLQVGWNPNARIIHITAAPPFVRDMTELAGYVNRTRDQIANNPNLMLVDSQASLKQCIDARDKPGIILGLQAVPDDVDAEVLHHLGIRITGIAYRGNNSLGGGYGSPETGLTPKGAIFVQTCARLGILVDLSHVSITTAKDVIAIAQTSIPRPRILITHSGCAKIYKGGYRNMPDDIIKGVAECGGVFGVYTVTFGLHPNDNSVAPFLAHLLHAIGVAGKDNVVIGSDGYHSRISNEEWEQQFKVMSERLKGAEIGARFPDIIPGDETNPWNTEARINAMYTSLITHGRLHSGLATAVYETNAMRFLREALA